MSETSFSKRTSVVTVSYKSGALLRQMLGSLPDGTETVVVNNAPEDEADLLDIVEGYERKTVITNPENTGFGAACNLGARHVGSEFVLFLNPDAQLKPGCIAALEEAADTFQKAVAFNPAMADGNGKQLFKRSSVLLSREAHLPSGWPSRTRKVKVLNGAALFIRKSAFDRVGGFDEKIFLYHEDDDLSIRLSLQAGELMFVREAEAIHKSGYSTPRAPETAALKAFHMGRSRVYATRKHGVSFARTKALASSFFQLFSPVVVLSKRKRAKQWAFFKGVVSVTFPGANA
ncbi:MAG: glycosyltransferase family 2 protein [Pseudomonadota bacterium]